MRSLHGQSVSPTVRYCANYSISAHPAGVKRKASWDTSAHGLWNLSLRLFWSLLEGTLKFFVG
jgi:hypothetical protein